ncbi:MAG: CDP-diacylglycerol--serine O-phosphatidyltransferase [Cellvibrionaceae bacterium]|jgi:CDP-diacylglycerol--serine O-phosphatidyltransferase
MSNHIKSVSGSDSQEEQSRSQAEGLIPVDEHIEEVSENGQKVRHKGVYLLPNLFTTGALFGGFYAIVAAMSGHFDHAAWAIFAAQILDGLDGRVARMTHTESAFGVQYDSLSDMVSFGLAPAILVYSWALQPLGKFGLAAAFVFTACAAMRLARFNTHVGEADNRYFTGLASPPAATLVASGVWLGSSLELTTGISIIAAGLLAFVGLLMVTNLRYLSFKGVDQNRRVPFVSMFVTVLVFAAMLANPPVVLFVLALTYSASGPVAWIWQLLKKLSSGQ